MIAGGTAQDLARALGREVLPPDVRAAYRGFTAGRPRVADPYYAVRAVRFTPREADVLGTPGDLRVERAACGVTIASERAGGTVEVCGVSESDARAVVAAVDSGLVQREARASAKAPDEAWSRVVGACFGVVIFAPAAVLALDSRASSVEVVRYPGSPYELVREYWENQADLAALLEEPPPGGVLERAGEFAGWLRELHAVLLAGPGGRNFYVPASPAAAKEELLPGEIVRDPSIVEDTPTGPRFVSGLRVSASAIGGEHHQSLLAEAAGDPEVLCASRQHRDANGVDWGRLVTARADSDREAKRWFCPPRPCGAEHFDALRTSFAHARELGHERAAERTRALAAFHQSLVRLHPFRAGNQSLAMALVNDVLRRDGGVGIPHLVLDHLALCLSAEAYARVFELAVREWTFAGQSASARLFELGARASSAFELLGRLGREPTLSGARALVASEAAAARLCLLPV